MGYWPVWLLVVPSHSSRFSNFAELHSDCHYFHCEYLILLSSLIFVVWSGIISGILSFSFKVSLSCLFEKSCSLYGIGAFYLVEG